MSITQAAVNPVSLPAISRGESSSSADYWREDAAEAWLREVADLRREIAIAELREGAVPYMEYSRSVTTAPPLYDALSLY